MLSSCPPDTENQHALTKSNNGIAPMGTQFPAITMTQMCRAAPDVFHLGAPTVPPSQTLEQWAAAQSFSGFAMPPARIHTKKRLTAIQIKRLAFYERLQSQA